MSSGPPISPGRRNPLVVSIQSAYDPSSANPNALDAESGTASASQRTLTGKDLFTAAILSWSAEFKLADLGSNYHNGENPVDPRHDCLLPPLALRCSHRASGNDMDGNEPFAGVVEGKD